MYLQLIDRYINHEVGNTVVDLQVLMMMKFIDKMYQP